LSVRATALAFDCDAPPLPRLVLLYLANKYVPSAVVLLPDPSSLAAAMRLDVDSVRAALWELHDLGFIYYYEGHGAVLFPEDHDGGECRRLILTGDWYPRISTKVELKRRALHVFALHCAYCGQQGSPQVGPDGRPWHLDQINPAARGGPGYVATNVALACGSCNSRKHAATTGWSARSLADLESLIGEAVVNR
jgi:5-methylcytosine-specific restriction endonuclease McrA